MSRRLRVMCWNIAEASLTSSLPMDSLLPRIAEQIRGKNPDIVLLNEVRQAHAFIPGRVDQTRELARMTGLEHFVFGKTVSTGVTGYKGVSVLSRFFLREARMHPVMRGTDETAFGTLEVTATIDNLVHRIFSTRFEPHVPADNVAGHEQAIAMLDRLDHRLPVIFGGDFNSHPSSPQFTRFVQQSGLTNAFNVHPDPTPWVSEPIDHVFFRGPYQVTQMEIRHPWPAVPENERISDHPWVFVELTNTQPTECANLTTEILTRRDEILEVREQLKEFNPRNPADARVIKRLNAKIKQLEGELNAFQAQKDSLGCL